jgi:acyl-CoA synthetase (AMP-forming)/AMP-acid ligase II
MQKGESVDAEEEFMMTVVDLVARNARMYPDRVAYVEVRPVSGTRSEITWGAFGERTNRIARALTARGIEKGMKVALLGRNSINWLEAFFGIMATGAWAVPLNFRFTDNDIKYCADMAEPALFLFDEEFSERIMGMKSSLPTVKSYISMGPAPGGLEELMARSSAEPLALELDDRDECALYFTSGTTGAPKAILHVHDCLMVSAITESTNHLWTYQDRNLMMAPLYHLGIGHLLGGLIVGASNVLVTEKITPAIILDTASREKITLAFLLVPWTLDILQALDNDELKLSDYDLSQWKLMYMGAQPIPPVLVKRWKTYFPTMQYDTTYGLSEGGGPGVIHLGMENGHKVGALGKQSLLWDVRIVDNNGEDVPRGEVGEFIVKSSGIMKEYYKNPEATARTVRNGWLFTGDLGKVDEDGFIYIVDRKKDLIISGGENIYPVEIEDVIRRHPKVHDVAVIGMPDNRLGEVICAVVQAGSGEALGHEEMTAFCMENLPRYKRPRRVIFAEVPRNAMGKLDKPKLRAVYAVSAET